MLTFRVTYKNGFEIVTGKDTFDVAEHLKRQRRRFFNTPVGIVEINRDGTPVSA